MTYKSSKGEEKIEKLLQSHKIRYKREYSFPNLKSLKGGTLRFDFALLDNFNRIICLIEVDGEQHFKQVKYFQKTKIDFRQTAENDRRKNAYCLKNKIPLIRIPYWALKDVTLHDMLYNQSYKVTNKFHNDLLSREV